MPFDDDNEAREPFADYDAEAAKRDRAFFVKVFLWAAAVMLLLWLAATINEHRNHAPVARPQVSVIEAHHGVLPVVNDHAGMELHVTPPEVHPPVVVDTPQAAEPAPVVEPSVPAVVSEPTEASAPEAPVNAIVRHAGHKRHHHRHHHRRHYVGHQVETGDNSWLAAFCKAAAHLAGYI